MLRDEDESSLPTTTQHPGADLAVRRRRWGRWRALGSDSLRAYSIRAWDAGSSGATDSIRRSAPHARRRHRLPLLPQHRGPLAGGQHPADAALSELPLADLEQEPAAGAGPRELLQEHADQMVARVPGP